MHAYIILLLGEMRGHYEEFCGLYGICRVDEVWEMVGGLGADGARFWLLVEEWEDLRFLVESRWVERSVEEGRRCEMG